MDLPRAQMDQSLLYANFSLEWKNSKQIYMSRDLIIFSAWQIFDEDRFVVEFLFDITPVFFFTILKILWSDGIFELSKLHIGHQLKPYDELS